MRLSIRERDISISSSIPTSNLSRVPSASTIPPIASIKHGIYLANLHLRPNYPYSVENMWEVDPETKTKVPPPLLPMSIPLG